jgi:predicted porin
MKTYALSALVAAGLLAGGLTTSANAADLGGNCCADLEERIAELEATTARKGNRKVSLTVSGWVGQQVTFWDDGLESNTYVHDLGTTLGSHVKFTGSAQISPGWTAGYVLQIEAIGSDGLTTSQGQPDGPAVYNALGAGATGLGGVQTLQSYWFVKSDQLGKIGVGKQSQASDNTAILVDGSGSLVPANWVAFDVNSFGVRLGDGSLTELSWGNAQSCFGMGGAWGDCNGLTQNVVRYDSPTFGGFSISASWGEDDMWDIAGRYAGEHHGFKLAAAVAYNEVTDNRYNNIGGPGGIAVPDMEYFQLGVYVQHVATGLFGLFNYGDLEVDIAGQPNAETYYFKGGLRTKFNHLGATIFYGEYLRGDDGAVGAVIDSGVPGTDTITASELDVWGLGVVQEIDAAAMSIWIKYRNLSLDVSSTEGEIAENGGFEDFNYVGVGALINF